MIGRVVEIAGADRYLHLDRGFLVVNTRSDEIGRVPIDDVSALVGNARGLSYSNNLLVALAERGIPFVVCGSHHRPCLLYTSPSPRDRTRSRMPSSA